MLGIVIKLPEFLTDYFITTTPDVMAAHLLFVLGPFVVGSVIIWGLLQVWQSNKQDQYWEKLHWDLLAVTIPQDAINTPKGMENFFNNLAGSKSAITKYEEWILGKFQAYFTFEIVSMGGNIQMYIRTTKKYRDLVEAALYAQYPEAQIIEVEDYTKDFPTEFPNDEWNCFGSEMSMAKEHYFPLKTYDLFEHQGEKDLRFKDPLLPMLEMLGKMQPGEIFAIQIVIISPDDQSWRKSGLKWIAKTYGKEEQKKKGMVSEMVGWIPKELGTQIAGMAFAGEDEKKQDDFRMFKITPDERDTLDAVKTKCTQIGWYGKVRVVYLAKHELFRKGTIAAMIKGTFNQFDSGINKLGLTNSCTPKDDYFFQEWVMPKKQRILVRKYKNRSLSAGTNMYILTAAELATMFHFPAADARTPVLASLQSRMSEAPRELTFAGADQNILPNFERSAPDVLRLVPDEAEKFAPSIKISLPTPTAPTMGLANRDTPTDSTVFPQIWHDEMSESLSDEVKPSVGMPAPLPPGLDISDEPIEEQNSPLNLPI